HRAGGPATRRRAAAVRPGRSHQVRARRARVSGVVARPGPAPERRERIPRVTIKNVAVLGSGLMGRGIAYASALGGYRTTLQDTSGEALERAGAEISALLEKGVVTGKVAGENATSARQRLGLVRGLEDA